MREDTQYSVVGVLETVRFIETLISKLLQFLLNPAVIFLGGIYIYVGDADQNLCQLGKYPSHRNYKKAQFSTIIAGFKKICSENHQITPYIYFLLIVGYLSILPTSSAFEPWYFLQN